MTRHLSRVGWCIGRKRVRGLMSKISLAPIYQAPKTSEPHPQRKIYTPAAAHDDRAAAEPGLVPLAIMEALDGQRLHRAAGTMTQIRVRVPQRLRGGELGRFGIGYCNAAWLRASFGGKTPDEVCAIESTTEKTEKLADVNQPKGESRKRD